VPRAAALIAPLQGLDVGVVETSLKRYKYGVAPLTAAVAEQQQKIADTFLELKLIPKAVRIADALPSGAGTATVAGR
jgi:sulfonate transport system substrate-binding protein